MATRFLTRSLLATTKQSLTSVLASSCTASSSSVLLSSSSFVFRIRPLVVAASSAYCRRLAPVSSSRGFATRQTTSSLNDPNPNWSNRPPKETILLDGCDFEHWLIVMEKPEGDPTRDEIIDSYIKTLATVVGSEEEARMKIYSVSTRHYFAFGALVSEELSYKLKELPRVRWVLPDSYLDVKNKDYGGEPFINGQAVPYDPKYHEEWVRNNARANERNRRNDRPRNFDRSRNFDRRREMQNNPNVGGPGGNMGGQPNMAPPSPNAPNAPNYGGGPPPNAPNAPNYGPPPNAPNAPNYGGGRPNYGGQPNYGGGQPNYGAGQPNHGGGQPSHGGGPNYGGGAPNNPGNYPPNNVGGAPYQSGQGQNPNVYGGGNPYQNQNVAGRDMPPPPNVGYGGPGPNQGNYAPNVGPGPVQNGYAPGNPPQNQNVPGRDFPPNSNY